MARLVTIATLLLILITGVRVFFMPLTVSSSCMAPTLAQSDHVFINRTVPLLNKNIERFDIIALVPPIVDGQAYQGGDGWKYFAGNVLGLPLFPRDPLYLRRVIALPGEKVILRRGAGVLVDDRLLEEASYRAQKPKSDMVGMAQLGQEEVGIHSFEDSQVPIVVPQGTVFVMADRRQEYPGSEKWGFISLDRVAGVVTHVLQSNELIAVTKPTVSFATEKIALNDRGVRALEEGNYVQAVKSFEDALAIDPEYERARENLAVAYNNYAVDNKENPHEALKSLHKALYLDPSNPLTTKNIAGIMKMLGKSQDSYDDRVSLAQEALEENDPLGALVEYREAIRLKPTAELVAKVSELEKLLTGPSSTHLRETEPDQEIAESLPEQSEVTPESTSQDPSIGVAEANWRTDTSIKDAVDESDALIDAQPSSTPDKTKAESKPQKVASINPVEEPPPGPREETRAEPTVKQAEAAQPASSKKNGLNLHIPQQMPQISDVTEAFANGSKGTSDILSGISTTFEGCKNWIVDTVTGWTTTSNKAHPSPSSTKVKLARKEMDSETSKEKKANAEAESSHHQSHLESLMNISP